MTIYDIKKKYANDILQQLETLYKTKSEYLLKDLTDKTVAYNNQKNNESIERLEEEYAKALADADKYKPKTVTRGYYEDIENGVA